MKINLTHEEVLRIIEQHVSSEILSAKMGTRKVSASGGSYTGLAATVTVEDDPVDSEKEA